MFADSVQMAVPHVKAKSSAHNANLDITLITMALNNNVKKYQVALTKNTIL